MEDDVRIAVVERADALSRPLYDGELLNAPDLRARYLPRGVPGGFVVAGLLTDMFLELRLASEAYRDGGTLIRTSEPRRAMFVSSMLYFAGRVRRTWLVSAMVVEIETSSAELTRIIDHRV